jgi:hypothetical protein
MSLTVSEPTDAIIQALNQKKMIALESLADGSSKVKPLGVFARIWHWNDANFHGKRLSKLAATLTKVVSQQERLSIAEATENQPLRAARNLLREASAQKIQSHELNNLRKEVTAAKLGISSTTLDHNPGLQTFIERHHLERYLLIYNHAIQTDPATHQVSLRKEGEFQPWNTILEETRSWKMPSHAPQLAWVYGQDGVHNKDMYDWNELKPFMKGDPSEWNHQYVFEFCACHNPNSLKNGVHSWFRLKTPTGDIYSAGLYRPDKPDLTENLKYPLRIKPGYLMQPDVSEFWDFEITTIDFAITEEIFLEIKQTVEADKKNEDLIFQPFHNNCLLYNKKLAEIGGVDLPTLDNVLYFMAPQNLAQTVSKFMEKLPFFVQKVCLYVTAFFLNIGQVFLGACMIDENLNEKQRKKAVPHLNSFSDLFDVNKIYLNHPNTLGFKTRQKVLEWRKQEIDFLNQNECCPVIKEAKEKSINLSLPPAFYTKTIIV